MRRSRSGRDPTNGSSRTRSSGSFTSAAISWTRCWFPCESASRRSLAAVGEAEPLEPCCRRLRLASARAFAAEPAEVDELIADPHPRVQAALLGHVPEPRRSAPADGRPAPAHRACVELDQPEHGPHRRRLPGAVRTEKPGQPTGLGREGAGVERGQTAEVLGRCVEFEHVTPRASIPPRVRSRVGHKVPEDVAVRAWRPRRELGRRVRCPLGPR